MYFIQALIMGFVQGLSEFLPISSSAHLVFTSNFYKIMNNVEIASHTSQEIFLDIMLHFGTLIAVIIFYREDIINIIKAFYTAFRYKEFDNPDFKIGIYIIVGTFITAIIAISLSDISGMLVFMPAGVGLFLVITGIILLLSEVVNKGVNKGVNRADNNLTLKKSILIGIAQGLASMPGFSRSGLTIATGMFSGMDRKSAAKYSFLLSIPVILGASMIYPLTEINYYEILTYNWIAIIAGTVVSGITGYFCIKYFIKFVEKFSLAFFGYYCIVMGLFAYFFFINKIN